MDFLNVYVGCETVRTGGVLKSMSVGGTDQAWKMSSIKASYWTLRSAYDAPHDKVGTFVLRVPLVGKVAWAH
jgi:hypothetical protein